MRKILLALFILLFTVNCYAGILEFSYYPIGINDTLSSVILNSWLQSVSNVLNGSLDNNNAATANGFRFLEIMTTVPPAGQQGRVVFAKDTNTLYFDTGSSMLAVAVLANTQTFTGTNTFSGSTVFSSDVTFAGQTIADLGSVTTADINGGTLDDVSISSETATGMIYVNNSSDKIDGLGSQGSSGQVLVSAGAGANPTWENRGSKLIETSAFSSTSTRTLSSLSSGKYYKLLIRLTGVTGSSNLQLQVAGETDGIYDYWREATTYEATPSKTTTGSTNATAFILGALGVSSVGIQGEVFICTDPNDATVARVNWILSGSGTSYWGSGEVNFDADTGLSSITVSVDANSATGSISLYEYVP